MAPWLPITASSQITAPSSVEIEEVLFFFDEPLIFVGVVSQNKVVCYKYAEDEDGEFSYYIAAPTSDRLISAAKSGRLSIRGLLSIPALWIYEADQSGDLSRLWPCSLDDIPEKLLPIRNVGLKRQFGSVPDTITLRKADAPFLSINFLGGELHAGDINFLDFKQLIDNAYGCLKDIIRRALLENGSEKVSIGQLEKLLNIPFRQPHLASLQLDIGRPSIQEVTGAAAKEINYERIDQSFDSYRERFLNVASSISEKASNRGLTLAFARENIEALENLIGLIPSEDTSFRTVEIIAEGSKTEIIRIDADDGQRILDAYKIAQKEMRIITGSVVELNYRSDSFIIKTDVGREITCVVPSGWAGDFPEKRGELITLSGRMQKRKRRDLFFIDRDTIAF